MKVLMINGSPNAAGCTFTALSEVGTQLEAQGIETVTLQLGTKPVQGCTACGGCRQGKCVVNSDVNSAIEIMAGCHGLVIGSPVYYAGVNGALISFLDRMFYSADKNVFIGKPGASLVSARRAGTTAALDQLNKYFLYSGMPVVASQYWCMVHGNTPQQVRQDAEGLQIMRTLGRNMAWLLKSIEAGRTAGIKPPEPEKRISTNFIR